MKIMSKNQLQTVYVEKMPGFECTQPDAKDPTM